MEQVKAHQNKAASDLYRALCAGQTGNVFLSPFSISTALSMVWGGAAGNTELEMREALALPADSLTLHAGYNKVLASLQNPPHVILNTANRLYVQNNYPILASYSALLKDKYLAELKNVDFTDAFHTSKLINDEVEDLTKGRIKNLIAASMLTGDTRAVLVNAIYFKGTWMQKFDRMWNRGKNFYLADGTRTETEMMRMEGKRLRCGFSRCMTCKALELPYEGGRFSMLIILPNTTDGLAALENQLVNTSMENILNQLPKQNTLVIIPRFKLETSYELTNQLKSLGISDIFCPLSANLSGVSVNKDIFISKVIHKTFIQVDEEGTEAAAATATAMTFGAAPVVEKPFEFVADHPFFFAIVDCASGLTLFLGRFVRPEK